MTLLTLALLNWRNTPSEQLGASPAQLMFGRQTRTRLPTTNALMTTPGAATAQDALTASKQRQASYYNHGAKEQPALSVGQTVRVRYDESDWRKAEVARVLRHRSYEVRFKDGTTRRRTSRHVRFSSEPPIVSRSDNGDDEAEASPSVSTSAAKPADHRQSPRRPRRARNDQCQPATLPAATATNLVTISLGLLYVNNNSKNR